MRRPTLIFFNIDLHVSVIEDVKTIWKDMLPDHVEIVDWSISGHANLFSHAMTDINPVLNGSTWRHFDESLIAAFHQKFDLFLSSFDGFIVTHTPIFVMLFEKYHKPIIVVNSCRYHQPLCWSRDSRMLQRFHLSLASLHAHRLLTVVHNNIADAHFFQNSTQLESIPQYYIPSLCAYIGASYCPTSPAILLDDNQGLLNDWLDSTSLNISIVKKESPYTWENLLQYRAVIVLPREISYMTFTEYMTGRIPILMPSKPFLLHLIANDGLHLGTLRDYDMEGDISEWIEYADYYHLPENRECILYFDSFDHLQDILNDPTLCTAVLPAVHQRMKDRYEYVHRHVTNAWSGIFHFEFFQFIGYNFWPCLASFHLDVDYDNEPTCRPFYTPVPIQLDKIQPNDLIFVKTDLLPVFMSHYFPHIKHPFRILIAVSDLSPNDTLINTLIHDDRCVSIMSTNTRLVHDKIIHIPIGFAEPMRDNGRTSLLHKWYSKSMACSQSKDIDLFIRYFSPTSHSREVALKDELKGLISGGRHFKDTVHMTCPTEHVDQLHQYLHRSKFALCLAGNGIDTHYVYECLLNECVPIFLDGEKYPLYQQFGDAVIQIQHAVDLYAMFPTSHDLERHYKNIDWHAVKKHLFRMSYKYLRSCN